MKFSAAQQFLEWFNLDHLGRSAAQFDEAKLRWVNAQHLKAMADDASWLPWCRRNYLDKRRCQPMRVWPPFAACSKTVATPPWRLADWAAAFYARCASHSR
jgi:glutamyl-tRNA synthetase